MSRTIHITSVHYENPFWIDVQLDSIKKYLKVPYKTYMVHVNMPENIKNYKNDFDILISDSRQKFHNIDGNKLALPKIKKNLEPNDIVIKLDSDAFFINDIDSSFLDRVDREKFIALKEPRHEHDLNHNTAHPVFYAFKGEYLLTDSGLMHAMCTRTSDAGGNWWGGVNTWLKKHIGKWGVLERTNTINLHLLYFGIYGDLIYHHWAGSRIKRTREDRRVAKKEGVPLGNIIKRNEKLSESTIREISSDVDKFIKKLTTMKIRETMLPVLRPHGGKEEIEALTEVIESGWWGKGPKVAELEQKFAELVGAKYAIAVTSNSHGQDLVMKALDIKDGDVINPTISFMATAMIPLWQENITTNVVDVDPYTMNMDVEDVRRSITPNTKAIIAVNQAGVPAPIDEIREFYDGLIIEDCAHSCYTEGAGLKGDIAIWSFQAVKTMPCGDGGMITLDDEELYHKLKEMTWFGVSSTYDRVAKEDTVTGKPGYTWDYEVDKIGYKCYMIDINAAICLEQLKKLPQILDWRRHVQKRYNEGLCEHVERPPHTETVQYYCAKVPSEHRGELIDYLASKKVHTSVHFKPLHKYEIIQKHLTHKDREWPNAEKEWERLISLPVHPAMTEEDIDYVIYWVNQYFKENG